MRISDWSSDVCSSDLLGGAIGGDQGRPPAPTEKPHLTEQGNAVQPGHPIVGNEAKRVAVGLIGDKLRAGRIGADIQSLAQQQELERKPYGRVILRQQALWMTAPSIPIDHHKDSRATSAHTDI